MGKKRKKKGGGGGKREEEGVAQDLVHEILLHRNDEQGDQKKV